MSDIQQANIPASTVTLLASAARTETVTGTAVKGLSAARLLVMQLNVTAASGTLPTEVFPTSSKGTILPAITLRSLSALSI